MTGKLRKRENDENKKFHSIATSLRNYIEGIQNITYQVNLLDLAGLWRDVTWRARGESLYPRPIAA